MSKDEAFKKKVMEEEHFYLSFGNEFELYSGFKKTILNFLGLFSVRQNRFLVH